jgi:hypothetical protein
MGLFRGGTSTRPTDGSTSTTGSCDGNPASLWGQQDVPAVGCRPDGNAWESRLAFRTLSLLRSVRPPDPLGTESLSVLGLQPEPPSETCHW